jgi:secreted PhoX family phosphatase
MSLIDRFPPKHVNDRDDIGTNPTDSRPFFDVAQARVSRRGIFRQLAAGTAFGVLAGTMTSRFALAADENPSSLTFEELEKGITDTHQVAKGYRADVLIRWGDPVVPGDAAAFDIANQSEASQSAQFGYNCDFIGYYPLPAGSTTADHGLLAVNHEYTNAELMFDGMTADDAFELVTADQAAIEIAAHGMSIVEVKKTDGKWAVVADSAYNRRITGTTPMTIAGPAVGHNLLKTATDATGTQVLGMLNNCAGGVTPWGTVLTAEENFNGYFNGDGAGTDNEEEYARYGIGESWYGWWRHIARFDTTKEPNEPHRFGWMVEIDPYDASATPMKRTALGRFKHEGASIVVNGDGHVVVYMGDDERFDYVYRFVSAGTYNQDDRTANIGLLDEGTLSVARYNEDGTLDWLPLVHGEGKLTAENGFASQADILIKTRLAADLIEPTPMDRPEDIEASPTTGHIFAMLTNNSKRKIDQIDAANPRFDNTAGHIIEMVPPGDGEIDHAADRFTWEVFVVAGDPVFGSTLYGKGTTANGWFACPDNCAFDPKGRLWISTDQGSAQKKFGIGDGIFGMDTDGDGRAVSRRLFTVPRDAEMCGPCFTPDGTTLFVAVQHPGEGGTRAEPTTRWPDFDAAMPPRPSVVAIVKEDGGEIGS